ncbi:hypothetical protein ACRAWF_26950 [Streptomyces sp. L7]
MRKASWSPTRTASSGIPALVSYLHKRGLRARDSHDAGTYDGGKSCGLGSRGYYDQDAGSPPAGRSTRSRSTSCAGSAPSPIRARPSMEFSDAVAKSGRRMLLNLCNPLTDDCGLPHTPEQDAHNTYVYGPTTADSWRTGTDIAWGTASPGQWPNILRNMDANAWHPEAQGPGHYNDPDYLIPMRRMTDGSYELSREESTSQSRDVGRDGLAARPRLRSPHPVRLHAGRPCANSGDHRGTTRTRWPFRGVQKRRRTDPASATCTARSLQRRGERARSCCSTGRTDRSPGTARSA